MIILPTIKPFLYYILYIAFNDNIRQKQHLKS